MEALMSDSKIKKNVVSLLMVGIAALTALIAYFFLPDQIPMQWSGSEVIWYANKIAIFSAPLISVLFLVFFNPLLRAFVSKLSASSPLLPEIIMAGILFIFLSCEVFTILYCFGFVWHLAYILIIEVILLLLLCGISMFRFNRAMSKQQ